MFKIESNLNEVLNVVTKKLDALKGDQIIREAAFSAVALVSNRVQQEGKKTDGTQIGEYSDKTLTFKGITGKFGTLANKKQIKKRMSEFGDHDEFYGGYKELRESLGLQTEFVDLTFTGDMMGDFIPVAEGTTSWVVGFRGKLSSDKADWNERKYGKVFHLSNGEMQKIRTIINNRINEQLSK